MSAQWRIGLVGVSRGSGYGRLIHNDPKCEIVALCDRSETALARQQRELGLPDAACFTDYDELVGNAQMDAVVVATPIPAHAEQAVKAVEAGLHVFSEVTAADTVDGCRRIVEAVRASGRIYMMAENNCFLPFIRQWKQWIREGRLGEIFYSEAEYLHPIAPLLIHPETGEKYWRNDRPPIHYCSHSLGPILELTDDRIVRVMCIGDGKRMMPEAGVGGVDIQVALFETRKKAIIKMLRTQVAPRHPAIHYYTLQGTKGFVENDRVSGGKGLLYIRGESEGDAAQEIATPQVDESLSKDALAGGHGTSDYSCLQEFLTALETGRKPWLDEVRAWDITVPGLLAAESAANGGKWMEAPPAP